MRVLTQFFFSRKDFTHTKKKLQKAQNVKQETFTQMFLMWTQSQKAQKAQKHKTSNKRLSSP